MSLSKRLDEVERRADEHLLTVLLEDGTKRRFHKDLLLDVLVSDWKTGTSDERYAGAEQHPRRDELSAALGEAVNIEDLVRDHGQVVYALGGGRGETT